MRRTLTFVLAIAALAALAGTSEASSGGTREAVRTVAAAGKVPTVRIAGPQHWCGTNGVTCSDPATNWDEIAGYQHAVSQGAPILPYIGHDEPSVHFFYTAPDRATTSRSICGFQRIHPPGRARMAAAATGDSSSASRSGSACRLCDDQGAPNPDGAALSGHPTIPCKPDSDSNLYASPNPSSPRYFGLGPGQGFMELQFYPPGWVAWPAGVGCDATRLVLGAQHRHIPEQREHRRSQQCSLPEHGRDPSPSTSPS